MVWLRNPETGHNILKGGRTYNKLKSQGVKVDSFKKSKNRYTKTFPKKKSARKSPTSSKRKFPTKSRTSPKRKYVRKSPNPGVAIRARRAVGKAPRRRSPSMSPRAARTQPLESRSPRHLEARHSRRHLESRSPRHLEATLSTLPKSRNYKRTQMKKVISRAGEGRGSPTRGWGGRSPQRGRERHELMDRCGKRCFLKPDTEGYPVCAALRTGQGCKYDCGGAQAAYNRARQQGQTGVSRRAQRILRKEC